MLGRKDRPIPDRHAAGCFLFMVYARARFSDMLNVGKLEFDSNSSGTGSRGYVEAEVTRSKTSFSVDRKVRLLPMTATMNGVAGDSCVKLGRVSKYIEPWSRRRFASAKSLDFPALTSKANEPCLSGYKLQLGLTGMTRKISSCSWPMPKNSKKPSEILKRCAT